MQVTQKRLIIDKMSEHILVVKTDAINTFLKSHGAYILDSGIAVVSKVPSYKFLEQHKELLIRRQAEQDNEFKQIIPYVTLCRGRDEIFVTRRSKKTTEGRLKDMYSLGIGGHLYPEDFAGSESIFDLAVRELEEEVAIELDSTVGQVKKSFKGFIVDNTNSVGLVHLGLWMEFVLPINSQVSIKSELASGSFVKNDDLFKIKPELEPWSRIILNSK